MKRFTSGWPTLSARATKWMAKRSLSPCESTRALEGSKALAAMMK
jgi:hypothetical protein